MKKANKKIPVAIIGAGRIGMLLEKDLKRVKPATHFGMWLNNKKANLVAICDKDKKKLKFARKLKKNIKFFENPKEMILKTKPKIVSISTWKDTHYKMCKLCISMGLKVIILEKPLTNNIGQAKKLIKIIKKNKVKLIVNHRRRFDTEIIKLRNYLRNNLIGKIKQVSCYYVYGLLTTGTHVIDTLRMLLKDIAGEITHVIGVKNYEKVFKPKSDENYEAFLFFKNGLTVSMQSLNIKDYDIFDFYFYGSKGKILLTDIGRTVIKYNIHNSPEHTGFTEIDNSKPKLISSTFPRKQFKNLANNAINCLRKNSNSMCNEMESFYDMKVINAIVKSAKNKSKKIKV